MATFEAIFLKISTSPDIRFFHDVKSFLKNHGLPFYETITFRHHENYPWIQIQNLPWIDHLLDKKMEDSMPKFAGELSEKYKTDVICIYGQTVVDAYGYWHFKDGEEKRALIHGFYNERIWEEIRGNNEKWEDDSFFKLEKYEDILSDEDEFAERVLEVCRTKRFETNSEIPFFTSRTIIEIGQYFQLPGIPNRLPWKIEEKI